MSFWVGFCVGFTAGAVTCLFLLALYALITRCECDENEGNE